MRDAVGHVGEVGFGKRTHGRDLRPEAADLHVLDIPFDNGAAKMSVSLRNGRTVLEARFSNGEMDSMLAGLGRIQGGGRASAARQAVLGDEYLIDDGGDLFENVADRVFEFECEFDHGLNFGIETRRGFEEAPLGRASKNGTFAKISLSRADMDAILTVLEDRFRGAR